MCPAQTHSDACWGSQIGSAIADGTLLPLFKFRSMNDGIIFCNGGPGGWIGERQERTSLSSCEAEIWATNATSKKVVDFCNLCWSISDSGNILSDISQPTILYNNNDACVRWSYNMTSKATCHIELWENSIREWVQNKSINVKHVSSKIILADIFTKEMRDGAHTSIFGILLCHVYPISSMIHFWWSITSISNLLPHNLSHLLQKKCWQFIPLLIFLPLHHLPSVAPSLLFHIFAVLVVSFSGIFTGMFHHILYSSGSTHNIGSVWSLPIVPSQLVTSWDFSLGNLPNSFWVGVFVGCTDGGCWSVRDPKSID